MANAPASPISRPIACQHNSLPYDKLEYVLRARAQRHANADFVRALRDCISHHRVNANGCKHQCQKPEKADHNRRQSLGRHSLADDLLHRLDVENRQRLVNRAHFASHG